MVRLIGPETEGRFGLLARLSKKEHHDACRYCRSRRYRHGICGISFREWACGMAVVSFGKWYEGTSRRQGPAGAGSIEREFHPQVAEGAADLAKCDVIVLALPAYGYRRVLDELVDYLEARHTVVISAHLSFAALYLAKKLSERGL
jgi:hypothetical protein